MTKTRYDELLNASETRTRLYENYEAECRAFIRQFRDSLIEFLGCSEDHVEWLRFTEDESEEELGFKRVVKLTSNRLMALYEDAFYGFIFRITFDSRYVDFRLRVHMTDSYFVVQLGDKMKIRKGNQEDLDELINRLFEGTKEFLEGDFQKFIQGQSSTLGFKTS